MIEKLPSDLSEKAFQLLALRYLDGVCSEEEARRLAETIQFSPEKRSAFAALSVEVGVLGELGESHCSEKSEIDLKRERRPMLHSIIGGLCSLHCLLAGARGYLQVPALVLTVAAFLLGAVFGWSWQQESSDRSLIVSAEGQAVPVAYLASANGCNWGNGSPQMLTVGGGVQLGEEVTLHEGIAEFRLSSGVSLSVEGPAALVLASPTSLVLQHGKLTAHVPWSVVDFRVLAASCRITASEAEFGVDYSGGKVDVHVFSGVVDAASSPFFKRSVATDIAIEDLAVEFADFDPVRIRESEAILFAIENGANELPVRRAADPNRFATKLSMSGRLPVSQRYVEAVRASKPTGYWRFKSIANGTVPNEIEGGTYLKVVGDLALAGDVQNRVAEFGRVHASGHLVSDAALSLQTGDGYTVELWAKPSHFHRGVMVSLTTENRDPKIAQPEKHGLMLEFLRSYENHQGHPGSIRFLHRNPPGIRLGTSCFSDRLYALRRWQHIVAVKHKQSMHLYLDGNLVAQEKDATPLPQNLHLVVGQTFHNQSVFPFVGQLDELAVYGRALGKEEIKEHWKLIQEKRPDDLGDQI